MREPAPNVPDLEALPQFLPAMDPEAVARLAGRKRTDRHPVKTTVSVKRIEPRRGELRVVFTHDGPEHTAEAGRIVNGAGRMADIDALDLATGNVGHGHGRIALDRYLRSTSNPHVFVCGDAVPTSPQLSPLATYEGDIVGRNIVEGPKHTPDYIGMATSVYTVPALAAVGLTEAAAGRTVSIEVHANDMQNGFRPGPMRRRTRGRKYRRAERPSTLGAHFVGLAQELINIFGLAIKFGITASQLRETSTPIRRPSVMS